MTATAKELGKTTTKGETNGPSGTDLGKSEASSTKRGKEKKETRKGEVEVGRRWGRTKDRFSRGQGLTASAA